MNHMRALGASFVAALALCFAALLTRATYEGLTVGTVAQSTFSMLIVTGFLVVAGVAVLASQGRIVAVAARRCPACGSHLYSTIRSLDRRPLLTCFGCGHESVAA